LQNVVGDGDRRKCHRAAEQRDFQSKREPRLFGF
jgi:hypothetical protein